MFAAPRRRTVQTTDSPAPKRVWVVTKHPLVTDAIKHGITTQQLPLVVTSVVPTSSAAATSVVESASKPDVLLIDFRRHCVDEVEALTRLAIRFKIPTVIYSSERRPYPVRKLLLAGVAGFVLKTDPVESLLSVVLRAQVGQLTTSGPDATEVAAVDRQCANLAPRVLETVKLLSIGRTRAQVAVDLEPTVKPSTVSTYIQRAFGEYRKLGREVESTCGLVHEARLDGYLDDGRQE